MPSWYIQCSRGTCSCYTPHICWSLCLTLNSQWRLEHCFHSSIGSYRQRHGGASSGCKLSMAAVTSGMNPAAAVQRHVLQQRLTLPSACLNQLQHLETPVVSCSHRRCTAYSHSSPLLKVRLSASANGTKLSLQLCMWTSIHVQAHIRCKLAEGWTLVHHRHGQQAAPAAAGSPAQQPPSRRRSLRQPAATTKRACSRAHRRPSRGASSAATAPPGRR